MEYLIENQEIIKKIDELAFAKTLWLDTEIADWSTNYPRLSLIQVLVNTDTNFHSMLRTSPPTPLNIGEGSKHTGGLGCQNDVKSQSVYILDVLDKHDLASYFIEQIMINPQIEKVFHNASFDLKYLGGKSAQNVTCTFKIAQKITKTVLRVSNLQLKTLAVELCKFSDVDKEEQGSDWGRRPLSQKQLQYAAMDTVYLAAVHQALLPFSKSNIINSIFDMAPISGQSPEKPQSSSLTPTKLRTAFECPRLFYLKEHFGGNTLFLPPENAIGIGQIFHDLADELINLLVSRPHTDILKSSTPDLTLEEVANSIQQLYYNQIFYSYLQKLTIKDSSLAQPLFKVWQGLQGLIRRFAELLVINRRYCNAESVIRETFIAEDRKLEHYFTLPNNSQQRVAGRFDCLVFNFETKHLCVIEFKTYQPVDPSAQLAQVAVYSYMMWHKKKAPSGFASPTGRKPTPLVGSPIDSAVYCVLPEFKEYYYPWEQLQNTVHQLIPYKLQQMQEWLSWAPPSPNPPPATTQPHLCKICPQQKKCQSYFVVDGQIQDIQNLGDGQDTHPARLHSTEYSTGQDEQLSNADAIGENLVTTLQSFGIGVDFLGVAVAPAFIRVKLKPQLGVKINALLKLSADLQVQMGLLSPPLIAPQAGYVSIDLPRTQRQVAKFQDYVESQILPATAAVKIAIGVNLEGKLLEADLSDPNTCHFLIGGTTGSGKSEFLRALLLSLLVRHSPQNLKIVLVDPKRVTFPEFEGMKWLYSPVVKDGETAIELMESLVGEMEKRYQQFEKTGCNDLSSYNQRSQTPLPRIVCIFDEYADFMAEKELRKALEQSIKRLGAMARAAGIHLIIATQRPEAGIVTPIIRSNLPGRVALRTASEADSMIIFGGKQNSAAYLLGKGDLLYQAGAYLHRLQSLFATNIKFNN
ncbi:MAG: PD-(D/E)XK nuclease family protein [Calothrix sp. C42_A2020_038]|nr:PD-(D/E)XK nuclease family protein [Calothrix sp. C42_A2020_038]